MTAPVRWYNRLAAWLYDRVMDLLSDLAMPVWMEQAEADAEEEYDAYEAAVDAAFSGREDDSALPF